MSKPSRLFDLVGFLGSILNALFSLFRSIWDAVFPRDQARADDALAAHVDQQTERLLASEPDPEPSYDLASSVREFVLGQDVSLAHLPSRQRFNAVMLFEHHVDLDMLSDSEVEAYVRGDHRMHGLPDIWTKESHDRAYKRFMAPQEAESSIRDDEVAPVFGM